MDKISEEEWQSASRLIDQVKEHSMKGYIIGVLERWANDGFCAIEGEESYGAVRIAYEKDKREAEFRAQALDMALRTCNGQVAHANDVIWTAQKYVDYILKGQE